MHRGALVGMGYWNDAEKTAERYKPLPRRAAASGPACCPRFAVFSGDTVRTDAEGFLYFIGRRDEMIKTSGYRVSPTEVEEVAVRDAAGRRVRRVRRRASVARAGDPGRRDAAGGERPLDADALLAECRQRMPAYMVPAGIEIVAGPLPRNPNGKIDRKLLAALAGRASRDSAFVR